MLQIKSATESLCSLNAERFALTLSLKENKCREWGRRVIFLFMFLKIPLAVAQRQNDGAAPTITGRALCSLN